MPKTVPTTPTCPVTGEPLPLTDPGRAVSQTACNQLRVAASNLADIMTILDLMIQGTGSDHTTTRTAPGSKPPLNLGLLAKIDDDRDTIDVWANNLAQHVNPNLRYRPGDWQAIQAVFTQYADKCSHWRHGDINPGALCIERVTAAIQRLERIAFPRQEHKMNEFERLTAKVQLEQLELQIEPAREAVRLLTGRKLSRDTVYSWERRGKIKSVGDPKRFRVRDLLELQ